MTAKKKANDSEKRGKFKINFQISIPNFFTLGTVFAYSKVSLRYALLQNTLFSLACKSQEKLTLNNKNDKQILY